MLEIPDYNENDVDVPISAGDCKNAHVVMV